MVTIKFNYQGEILNGVFLAKYERLHNEIYTIEKKFFKRLKKIEKIRKISTPLYLIFIPYRHKEKEIVEIDEKHIINLDSLKLDDNYFKAKSFVSKTNFDYYNNEISISNFIGYKFIYDYNSFIANITLQETYNSLDVLYKNMPELLNIDLKNNYKEKNIY